MLSTASFSAAHSAGQSTIDEIFGPDGTLADSGIEVGLGITNIYQQIIHGGLSTHRKAGRHTGSYDIEVLTDLEKMFGFDGGSLFVHLEGGWPDTEGIDGGSVGSVFGVNADAIGNRAMDVKQLFYAIFAGGFNRDGISITSLAKTSNMQRKDILKTD